VRAYWPQSSRDGNPNIATSNGLILMAEVLLCTVTSCKPRPQFPTAPNGFSVYSFTDLPAAKSHLYIVRTELPTADSFVFFDPADSRTRLAQILAQGPLQISFCITVFRASERHKWRLPLKLPFAVNITDVATLRELSKAGCMADRINRNFIVV